MNFFHSGPIRQSFRTIPTLETDRLILRKILPSDAQDMYEYSRHPEVSRYLLWEAHPSLAHTQSHISYLQEQYAKGKFFDWAIIWKENGKMIGTCGYTQIYEKDLSAEIGYVLSAQYHRRGIAPEAIRRIMTYAFQTLGLESLTARVMESNEASLKVLSRLGFELIVGDKESFYKRGKKERILSYRFMKSQFEKTL